MRRREGLLCIALILMACSGERAAGPAPVGWDRDTCEQCNMLISDRRFAAQVRSPVDHRIRRFDDFGCAVRWLDDQEWNGKKPEEFWVRAMDADRWLAAETATFAPVPNTPMHYGFGAVAAAGAEGIGFDAVLERIRQVVDERRNRHR